MHKIVENAMRINDLTREQAKALQDRLDPILAYLNKLRHRIQNKQLPLSYRRQIKAPGFGSGTIK